MKLWLKGLIVIVVLLGGGWVTYPIWGSWLLPPSLPEVVPLVKVTDRISDAAFSPADASVKMYDPKGVIAMPAADVAPFDFLDTLTETPDGEFTGTKTVRQATWVYLYITGTNYYTMGVFCQIPGPRSGTSGEANAIQIRIVPNTGPLAADVSLLLSTGGAIKTNATGLATGTYNYRMDVTATSGYGFGAEGYIDPTTGYFYHGGFLCFQLTTTTARGTITGSSIFDHFVIGSIEYWALNIGQVINDNSITTDGTLSVYFDLNNQVAAVDVFDVGVYAYRRPADIHAGSLGTSYIDSADLMLDIHFL